jgi:hypothetical protein
MGAAHGYANPALGPLRSSDFSGGEATVARKLEQLGFEIHRGVDLSGMNRDTPLVLVENEVTIRGRSHGWKDVTGERYHYPNQYRIKVVPGRSFIYYRGERRTHGKRGRPEYFGCGTIGEVWRDDDVPSDAPKRTWNWFCEIDDYQEFTQPVAAKQPDGFIEIIPSNLWGSLYARSRRRHTIAFSISRALAVAQRWLSRQLYLPHCHWLK